MSVADSTRTDARHVVGHASGGGRAAIPSQAGARDQAHLARRVEAATAGRVRRRPSYERAKRALDLVVSVPALLVLLPLIGLVALVIRCESPGPALFRQQRVTRGGRVITFYKFRTMYADARERFPELYAYTYTPEQFATAFYKPETDPRNTRFGRWIRKLTIDELPNLFNVVRGDVSLVGPRPELPEYVAYYTDDQLLKFSVPSGITGLAQVSGRNRLSVQQQIQADLEYVRRRSMGYDLRLLGRTAVAVLRRVGAE